LDLEQMLSNVHRSGQAVMPILATSSRPTPGESPRNDIGGGARPKAKDYRGGAGMGTAWVEHAEEYASELTPSFQRPKVQRGWNEVRKCTVLFVVAF
jgi:hypothetical protein